MAMAAGALATSAPMIMNSMPQQDTDVQQQIQFQQPIQQQQHFQQVPCFVVMTPVCRPAVLCQQQQAAPGACTPAGFTVPVTSPATSMPGMPPMHGNLVYQEGAAGAVPTPMASAPYIATTSAPFVMVPAHVVSAQPGQVVNVCGEQPTSAVDIDQASTCPSLAEGTSSTHLSEADSTSTASTEEKEKAVRRTGRRSKRVRAALKAAFETPLPTPDWSESMTISEMDECEECLLHFKWGSPVKLVEDQALTDKLLDHICQCSSEEVHAVVLWLQRSLAMMAGTRRGTIIVQKLLDLAPPADKETIAWCLRNNLLVLSKSAHGNYTVSKVVEVLTPLALQQMVIEELKGNLVELAMNQYGCRIVERLIMCCEDEADMSVLLDEIVAHVDVLSRHPYGNFVVQKAMERGVDPQRQAIFTYVVQNLAALAKQRLGSHVVQKLLKYACLQTIDFLVENLMQDIDTLREVVGNRYGGFVVEQLVGMDSIPSGHRFRATILGLRPSMSQEQLGFAAGALQKCQVQLQ